MLTSLKPTTPRLSPAALEAAATRLLAEAEGVGVRVIQNRDWRSVIQQGPSYEGLTYLGTNPQTLEDNGIDLGIIAASPFRDTGARGNPARSLDRNAWNAIRVLAPVDWPDKDVLIASAQYETSEKIGEIVGRCPRRVRQIQDRLIARARAILDPADILAHLDDPLLPLTVVVPTRAPSRRGRKARGAPPRPPRFLTLAPHIPKPPRARRPYRPRGRRARWVDPLQTDMFQEAA